MTTVVTKYGMIHQVDCLDLLRSLPEDSVDLVFGSPPYEAQRTYGIGFALQGQDWVDWMVEVFTAAQACCKGLVCFVVEGFTKQFQWSATPALLLADLHRAGFNLRKPPIYHRVGIPGSGGNDWLRNDWEWCICTSKGKLPWSDVKACGQKPKYGPGGQCTYRTKDGKRVHMKIGTTGSENGDIQTRKVQRKVTDIANPGNVIACGAVGGGHLGSKKAHENEAPFSEKLASFFIRAFCPPRGIVVDPFSGSGTTAAVAVKTGRRFLAGDVRESQVQLTRRRVVEAERTAGFKL